MRADRRWRLEAATAPRRVLPGVRARSALASVLVVGLALGAAGLVFFYVLQRSLLGGLDQAAAARASDVADGVRVFGVSGLDAQLKQAQRDDQIIQLVRGGQVVASSSSQRQHRPVTALRAAPGQVVREHAGPRKILDGKRPYLVLVRGVSHSGSDYSILVATSFQAQRASIQALLQVGTVAFPVLLLLVAVASWLLAGRALWPVESIRARVAGIGAGDLDDRVPIPPTDDEIAALAVTMNEMLDRLQFAQQAQRQFVADASHELRSPLATLTATLQVAAADPTGGAWWDLRQVMEDEADRMALLVEHLLVLAKVDDDGLALTCGDVDLDDLLEEEARRLRAATSLRVATTISPVRVQGDVLRLGQAIRNLVDNASRHAHSRIELAVRAAPGVDVPGVAVVTVVDDGHGIPVRERERVFERFVRLDGSRDRASGGSGLGLPIVAEVVRAHGGRVRFDDPDELPGCRAVLLLPMAENPDNPDEERVQPPSASSR